MLVKSAWVLGTAIALIIVPSTACWTQDLSGLQAASSNPQSNGVDAPSLLEPLVPSLAVPSPEVSGFAEPSCSDPSFPRGLGREGDGSVLAVESPLFAGGPAAQANPASAAYSAGTKGRAGLREAFPLFSGDASLAGIAPVATSDRSWGTVLFYDYDAFMGPPDSGWANNGARAGVNFGNRLGWLTERTGICSQIGGSVGVYDWAGTAYRLQHQDRAETQGFLTYGLYRRPTNGSSVVGGLVQDWSFNDTYGIYAQNPVLSQLRGQVGYAASASNEYGILGATHLTSATRNVPTVGQTTWRPISQLSAYWHHKWNAAGPDTWLTFGVPSHSRLAGGGSVGDYLVSAIANCPLNNSVALASGVTYMHPSSRPGPAAAFDEMWNFSVGISFYPWRNARNVSVAGQQAMPLLNVANNGSFLVESDRTFY